MRDSTFVNTRLGEQFCRLVNNEQSMRMSMN